ncbi:hypothetical protein [Streptomyces sp. CBMA156]|uniref:hypothetical protein n=1 Tax=Streptomyces sp. CBMA156 TaxID=1930280 RepID=UPI001662011F|nr:hypothetical protein [Streptomyces sp. CBMA156]MBD0675602.1 hypothetical protein [Streptomyces sp. CBMA156]
MSGTVITDLRRRGAVDPGRLLAGPLRGVGLQRLDPGHRAEVAADGVEHAIYVTAGSGLADLPESFEHPDHADGPEPEDRPESDGVGLPLVEGTAVVLPLGSRTVLTAGLAGLEFFHAVLAVPVSSSAPSEAPPEGGDPR